MQAHVGDSGPGAQSTAECELLVLGMSLLDPGQISKAAAHAPSGIQHTASFLCFEALLQSFKSF